ncbi:MAG: FHA domain-containing protein [Pirellulaceae bacterium]
MIVVLEVVSGSQTGKRITIRGDQIFTFGRTNLADEMFPDDVMMSGKHFQIENNGQFSFISDLGSRNGTKVDDGFIKKLDLKDGHTIQAGRTRFSVQIEGGARNPYETIQGGSGLGNPSFPSEKSDPRDALPGHGTRQPGDSGSRPGVETPMDLPNLPDAPPHNAIDPQFPAASPMSPGMPMGGGINPNLIGDALPPANDGPVGSGAPPSFPANPPGPPASGQAPPMDRSEEPQFKFFNRPTSVDPGAFTPAKPGGPPPPLGKVPLSGFANEATGGADFAPVPPPSNSAPPTGHNGIDNLPAMGPTPMAPPISGPPGGGIPPGPLAPPPAPPQPGPPPAPSPQSGRGVSGLPSGGFGQVKNPNLIGWDDEPEATTPPSGGGPWSGGPASGGSVPNSVPPGPSSPSTSNDPPTARSDWRNPPLSAAPPVPVEAPAELGSPPAPLPATEPKDAPAEPTPRPTSKLAIRFGQETTSSNLHVCRTFSLDEATGEVSPSRLLQALAKQSKLVLAIHFMRAGIEIPEDLTGGVPIRSDLPAEVAKSAGPILLLPDEIPAFADVVDQAWDQDAMIGFLTRDPAAAIRHLQQVIFFDDKLEARPNNNKALFCAVYSPNLFSSFLSTRDESAVKRLMGDSIDAVITEVPDLPGNWQLLGLTDWTERLTKLGLKQQEASEISGPSA